MLQKPFKTLDEVLAILFGELRRAAVAAPLPAELRLCVTHGKLGIDRGEMKHTPARADGSGASAEDHGCETDVLCYHGIARREALDNREVGRVVSSAHLHGFDTPPGGVPLEVLGAVGYHNNQPPSLTRNRDRLACDGTGIGVYE